MAGLDVKLGDHGGLRSLRGAQNKRMEQSQSSPWVGPGAWATLHPLPLVRLRSSCARSAHSRNAATSGAGETVHVGMGCQADLGRASWVSYSGGPGPGLFRVQRVLCPFLARLLGLMVRTARLPIPTGSLVGWWVFGSLERLRSTTSGRWTLKERHVGTASAA